MFNTKGKKAEERVLSWINEPGVYQVQFNKFTQGTAFVSGWYPIQVVVETEKVDASGFTPQENAKNGGRTAEFSFALLHDAKQESLAAFETDIATVASKILGESSDDNGDGGSAERDAFDKELGEATSWSEVLDVLNEYLTGTMVWLAITGREYEGQDGSIKVGLGRRRYGFIASVEEGEVHIKPFDKNNKYDYQKFVPATHEPELVGDIDSSDVDDLPFG